MIVETIITTTSAGGVLNIAPMGVEWDEEHIVVKPFLETVTFRNLRETRVALVNVTDDASIFAHAAVETPSYPVVPASTVRGFVLESACSWRELEVESIDATPPRSRIVTRVVDRGVRREFIGFNRARHAVLEAAILATRVHLIPAGEIRRELERLQVIVDKTAGPVERDAMAFLTEHVRQATPTRGGVP